MKPGSKEIAIEMMRVLALAGSARLSDQSVVNSLANSKFYQRFQREIETDPAAISRDLSMQGAANARNGSMKFYPLPFFHSTDIECVLFRPYFFNSWDSSKVEIIQIGGSPHYAELGYRIERGSRGATDRHGYLHVQMTDKFKLGLEVAVPAGLSTKHPAFPINDAQPYSPIYAAMVAFTGLQPDWANGLARELDNLRQYGNPANFGKLVESVKTTSYAILFQRKPDFQNRMAGALSLFFARWQRL